MQYIQEKFKYPYSLAFPTFINLEENHRYRQKYISPSIIYSVKNIEVV